MYQKIWSVKLRKNYKYFYKYFISIDTYKKNSKNFRKKKSKKKIFYGNNFFT